MKPERPNSCYNRPPLEEFAEVQDGYLRADVDGMQTRIPIVKIVPAPMTKDCQYTLTTPDPRCAGCIHEHKA